MRILHFGKRKNKSANWTVRELEFENNAGGCLLCFSRGSRLSCVNQLAEFSPKHTHKHTRKHTHTHVSVSISSEDITLAYIYFLETYPNHNHKHYLANSKIKWFTWWEHFVPIRKASPHNVTEWTDLCLHSVSDTRTHKHTHTQRFLMWTCSWADQYFTSKGRPACVCWNADVGAVRASLIKVQWKTFLHTKHRVCRGERHQLTSFSPMSCSIRGTQREGLHIKQHLWYNAGFVRWEEERLMLECEGREC